MQYTVIWQNISSKRGVNNRLKCVNSHYVGEILDIAFLAEQTWVPSNSTVVTSEHSLVGSKSNGTRIQLFSVVY
jgi:hypothetical protein